MKKLFTVLAVSLLLVACAKPDPLHDSMESMGDAFKAMREANDLAEIQTQWSAFKEALAVAEAQTMGPDEQPDFEQGMKELGELTQVVDAALASGQIDAVKEALKRMGEVRKEYHDKLNVD